MATSASLFAGAAVLGSAPPCRGLRAHREGLGAPVVTLYMGVPELDTSGQARPYLPHLPRQRHAPLGHGGWIY